MNLKIHLFKMHIELITKNSNNLKISKKMLKNKKRKKKWKNLFILNNLLFSDALQCMIHNI